MTVTGVKVDSDANNQAGLEFVDGAAAIGKSLDDRDEILMAVADAYANLGLIDDALAVADEISDSYSRDTAIGNVAVNVVASGPDVDPISLVDSIEDIGNQNLALAQISIRYAEQNLFDQALETCRQLEDYDSALIRIVPIIAERDLLERASELVEEIDDSNTRTNCLIELAHIAKAKKQESQAADFLVAAEAEVEHEEAVEERIVKLVAIAYVYKDLSEGDKAKEILRQAFVLSRDGEGSPSSSSGGSFDKDYARVWIAGACASCGDFAQADVVAAEIQDPFQFGQAAAKIGSEHHEAGQDSQALQMLSEAAELVASEDWFGEKGLFIRDIALRELAAAYAAVGHYPEGLKQALLMSDLEEQLRTLIDLGKKAALAGLTESMLTIYEAVDSVYVRALFLVEVSESLQREGKTELVVKLLIMAIEQADQIERRDQQCLMLIRIASGLSKTDLTAKASEILWRALETTIDVREGQQQARILLAMAEEYRRQGRELGAQEKEVLERIADIDAGSV